MTVDAKLVWGEQMLSAKRMMAAALAACVLTGSAMPAAADWQYTQWGMTPNQVKEGLSNGVARDNTGPNLDAAGVTATLVAPYQGVSLPFTAVFLFDPDNNLQDVTLNPVGQIACPVIVDALAANYAAGNKVDMVRAKTSLGRPEQRQPRRLPRPRAGKLHNSKYRKLPPTQPDGKGL